jgi:hypothetical protein
MEQEVFTDIVKGEKREIDILAEVSLKGENRIILIHVEPQSTLQNEFHERMFIYCSRLYEKFRKPILPIGVFSWQIKSILSCISATKALARKPGEYQVLFDYCRR